MASYFRTRFGFFSRRLSSAALAAALFGSVSLGAPPAALAQSASEKAAAEALFDEGLELLKQKKYEEACKKLESSQRIEAGIGTLLYLGECYKKVGRTASAWATFREAASKAEAAGESGRAKAGMARADEIEPSLSKVTFLVADETQALEGVEIKQSGSMVARGLYGTPVPVDPGEMKVTASAPGYETFELAVVVKDGPGNVEVKIPALVKLPEDALPPPGEETQEPETTPPPPPAEQKDPGAGRRTAGLVLGGVGLVGIGVGSVFGVIAMGKEGDARDVCDGATCDAGSNGVKLTDQAQSAALVSTIGFAAGGALLAGGLVLYFTAPSSREVAQMEVSPTVGGARATWKLVF